MSHQDKKIKRTEPTNLTVVLGEAWGDEGKGKLVDDLSQEFDIVARFAGGANAGHTVVVGDKTYKAHLLPSGVISGAMCLIGTGVVLHVPSLFDEIDTMTAQGLKDIEKRIIVSDRAHLVFDFHKEADKKREEERSKDGSGKIGTTGQGIGPCMAAKANRIGVRVCDLMGDWDDFCSAYELSRQSEVNRFSYSGATPFITEASVETGNLYHLRERLRPMVQDATSYIHEAYNSGKKILVEGANAAMLDLDDGSYPYVTSSSCTVGGVCTGLGVSPKMIGTVIGIMKAYSTRVGEGPFPTEQLNSVGEHLQSVGHEVGTTTGRKRRCGWVDAVVARYSHKLNGYTYMNLTKLDVLTGIPEISIGVDYTHEEEIVPGRPATEQKILPSMPASLKKLANVKVVYEVMPGWKEDITGVRKYEDLPAAARKYVERLEELMGVPIKYIGVGPARDATIEKPLDI